MSNLPTDVEEDLVLGEDEVDGCYFEHNVSRGRVDYSQYNVKPKAHGLMNNERIDSGIYSLDSVNNLFNTLSVADNLPNEISSNNSVSLASFKSDHSNQLNSVSICDSYRVSTSPCVSVSQPKSDSSCERFDSGAVLESLDFSSCTSHSVSVGLEDEPEEYVHSYFEPDEDGDTAVHNAIIQLKPTVCQQLISLAACYDWLNHQNNIQQTPLHLAVLTNLPQVVRRLMVAGAQVDVRDSKGNTPLHIACSRGYTDIVKMLLTPVYHYEIHVNMYEIPYQKIPQDLEMRNYDGLTCLHIAAQRSHIDPMRFLLENRANINVADGKSGRTILHYAAECGNEELLKFILQNQNIKINEKTYGGLTAIALAKGRGYIDAVELLYRHGADASGLDENEDDSDDDMDTMYDDIQIAGEPVCFS